MSQDSRAPAAPPRRRRFRLARALAVAALPLALGGGLLAAPAVRAETAQAADAAAFANIRIGGELSHFTLDNGLEVLVIPDHRAPVATHMIWYKVGAADEPAGMSGIAHFLEHLMFKGTKAHPDGAFSKRVAAIGGEENAFTSDDYTAYFQRVAKEHLAEMMALEADRMENLVLTDEVVTPEREVVKEERRMRVDSDPSSLLGETLDAMLYVNHPYGTPVIGWPDEITALSRDDAITFYNRFYTPNNAVLVVAGDVTADEVRKLAEETYGKVARRAEPGARIRPEPQQLRGALQVSLADPRVNQPSLRQAWLVPSYTSAIRADAENGARTAASLDVLSEVLGGGSTSRLYKTLVIDKGIASSAGGWYQSSALDETQFAIYAVPADGAKMEDVAAAADEAIATLVRDGITEEELERAKTSLLSSALYAQDSQTSIARIFGVALTTGSSVEAVRDWPALIGSITAADVQKAAADHLAHEPVTAYLRRDPSAGASAASAAGDASGVPAPTTVAQ
ncbi:M16 family metallopeptidase [Stappia sp.]|uniref:M16 family metallopeptidase n=1 Tax=Stappia sp. TaxID=1870903 RepID=UPI003A991F2E